MTEKTLSFWKNIYAVAMSSCVITDDKLNILFNQNTDLTGSLAGIKIRLYDKNGVLCGLPEGKGCYGFIRHPNRLTAVFMARLNDTDTGAVCGYIVKFVSPYELFGGRLIDESNTILIREKLAQIVTGTISMRTFLETTDNYQHIPQTESIIDGCFGILSGITNSIQIGRLFRGKLKWCHCNVSQLLEETLSLCRHRIAGGKRELTWDIDSNIILECDEDQIKTVAANLVLNGFMYNISETKKVNVSLKQKDREAILTVTDNGIGIPSGIMKNVFFRKPHTSDSNTVPGSEGMGLIYVSLFAELMNGSLSFLSNSIGGSTVIVRLPIEHSRECFFKSSNPTYLSDSFSPLNITLAKFNNIKD